MRELRDNYIITMCAGRVTPDSLEQYSLATLAAIYRELTGETVKKFRDRKTAIERVFPVVEEAISSRTPPDPVRQGKQFNVDYPAKETQKANRPNTKLRHIVELCRQSPKTVDFVCQQVGCTEVQLRAFLYHLHHRCGWGIKSDANQYLRIFGANEEEVVR